MWIWNEATMVVHKYKISMVVTCTAHQQTAIGTELLNKRIIVICAHKKNEKWNVMVNNLIISICINYACAKSYKMKLVIVRTYEWWSFTKRQIENGFYEQLHSLRQHIL